MKVNEAIGPATPEDFARWETAAAGMSDAELDYAIRDALSASDALDGVSGVLAGRYADECLTYAQERQNRRQTSTVLAAPAWGSL